MEVLSTDRQSNALHSPVPQTQSATGTQNRRADRLSRATRNRGSAAPASSGPTGCSSGEQSDEEHGAHNPASWETLRTRTTARWPALSNNKTVPADSGEKF